MKKFLSIVLALCMVSGCIAFAVPVLDTAEGAEAAVQSEETVLAATGTAKPGLNVWTSTAEPYTFDNATVSNLTIGGTTTLEANGTNKYVKLGGSLAHFTLNGSNLPVIPSDRKVKVSFNFMASERRTVALIRNVMNNTTPTWGQKYASVASANTWNNTYTQDIFGTGAGAVTNKSSIYKDDTQDIKNIIIMGINSDLNTSPLYIDNVSVVPYYKVTYDADGGVSAPADVWWLPTSSNPTYTVSTEKSMRAGYKFLGWSVDGVNVATTVTPANEDIVLTAIWEEDPNQEALSYTFDSDVPGVADGTLSIIAPGEAYTTATIYLADENGALDEYTAFGTASLTQGMGTYTVTGNRAFTAEATELSIVFTGTGLEEVTKTYTIPEEHRMPESTPLYTYFVVSDPHLGGSATNIDYFYMQWQSTNPTRTKAFGNDDTTGDVFKKDANGNTAVDFVIVNGDLVNYGAYTSNGVQIGEERYWDILDSYIENRFNIHGIPVFLTNGNHEFYNENNTFGDFFANRLIGTITGQVDYIEENYGRNVQIIRDENNDDALYYAANMGGAKYIFMSTPEMTEDKTSAVYAVSDKQLAFVEAQLEDAKTNGNTSFIMTHIPIDLLTNKDAVEAVLAKYPNTIVFTSHTHDNLSYDEHYTVVGDMISTYTTSNTGATSYLNTTESGYETSFVTGQYVEVYTDKILIKSRKMADESSFFGHALYLVDTPDENAFNAAYPETVETQEMRITSENGKVTSAIRFKGIVSASQKNAAAEYGFIATRKVFLETMDAELNFDLTYGGKNLFVYGTAYALDENGEATVDKVYGNDEDGNIIFSAALTGIENDNADQVNEVLVARPYIKYSNGDKEFTFYGKTAENSLVGVAKNVDTAALPENYKTAVEGIVALEKTAE